MPFISLSSFSHSILFPPSSLSFFLPSSFFHFFLFLSFISLSLFLSLIVLTRTSTTVLNRNCENGHPCLFLILERKYSGFHIRYDLFFKYIFSRCPWSDWWGPILFLIWWEFLSLMDIELCQMLLFINWYDHVVFLLWDY